MLNSAWNSLGSIPTYQFSAAVVFIMTAVGFYLATFPPDSSKRKWTWIGIFVLLGSVQFVVTLREGRESDSNARQLTEQLGATTQALETNKEALGNAEKALATVLEQTKQPHVITVPPHKPMPLPTYSMGGEMNAGWDAMPDWFDVLSHEDVELDWATLAGIDAFAEITMKVSKRGGKKGETGPPLVRARVMNLTDKSIAGETSGSEPDSTKRVRLRRAHGVKKYRLQMWPIGAGKANVYGRIVLQHQSEG